MNKTTRKALTAFKAYTDNQAQEIVLAMYQRMCEQLNGCISSESKELNFQNVSEEDLKKVWDSLT